MHLKQSQKPKPEPKAKAEPKPKAAKKEVPKCQSKTAKGEDCPRKVCEESEEFCAMHLKQSQKPKAEPKKAKAEVVAGKPVKQAVAIAYSVKHEAAKKPTMKPKK